MAKETKLVDFGQKIGGARKDVWKSRGLSLDDLFELTDSEAKKVRDQRECLAETGLGHKDFKRKVR